MFYKVKYMFYLNVRFLDMRYYNKFCLWLFLDSQRSILAQNWNIYI